MYRVEINENADHAASCSFRKKTDFEPIPALKLIWEIRPLPFYQYFM